MNIPERISALRALMEERGYDVYMVPTDDFHQSEYVGDHFKVREYITGFTGSAGTAVFTKDEAGLWTDGRYFLQADQQLAGTGVKLYKMGEPGVPTVEEFIASALPEGGTLGFDGRVVAIEEGAALEEAVASKDAKINYSATCVGLRYGHLRNPHSFSRHLPSQTSVLFSLDLYRNQHPALRLLMCPCA